MTTVPHSSRSRWLEALHEPAFRPPLGHHRHSFHQVTVCLSGGINLTRWNEGFGLRKIQSRHRNVVVNPAHALHSTVWAGSWDRVVLNLDCEVVRRAAAELDMSDDLMLHPTATGRDETIWHLAFTLLQEMENDPLACALYAESMANLLAFRLLKHFTSPATTRAAPVSPLTSRQMAVIDEHVTSNLEAEISVAQLASLLGLGQLQFSRRLKVATGMSPHQYVTSKRVRRACELLSDTKQPIADIGLEVGFSGQSHFSARFKQVVGTTPREYRAMTRGG